MGVLITTAAIACSVAVGVWAERRWPAGAAAASRRSLLFVLYVLIPPVIFFNLASSEIDLDHGVGLLLGLLSVALTGLAAWWAGARVLRLPPAAIGAVICSVICINSAYLGYPMTIALLGRAELSTAVLFDLAVAAPAVLLGAFAVGAALGTSAGEGPRQRALAFFTRNPPLYAAIAGLLAPEALAPEILVDASQTMVIAILPIGFFAVGATLAEDAESGNLPLPPRLTAPVALAVGLRLLVAPAVLLALAAPLIDLPDPYLLIAAMPTGINAMIVAHAYGLDMEITAEAVTWSTAIVVAAALASLAI